MGCGFKSNTKKKLYVSLAVSIHSIISTYIYFCIWFNITVTPVHGILYLFLLFFQLFYVHFNFHSCHHHYIIYISRFCGSFWIIVLVWIVNMFFFHFFFPAFVNINIIYLVLVAWYCVNSSRLQIQIDRDSIRASQINPDWYAMCAYYAYSLWFQKYQTLNTKKKSEKISTPPKISTNSNDWFTHMHLLICYYINQFDIRTHHHLNQSPLFRVPFFSILGFFYLFQYLLLFFGNVYADNTKSKCVFIQR